MHSFVWECKCSSWWISINSIQRGSAKEEIAGGNNARVTVIRDLAMSMAVVGVAGDKVPLGENQICLPFGLESVTASTFVIKVS